MMNNTNDLIGIETEYNLKLINLHKLIADEKKKILGKSNKEEIQKIISALCESVDDANNLLNSYANCYNSDLSKELSDLSSSYEGKKQLLYSFIELGILSKDYPHNRIVIENSSAVIIQEEKSIYGSLSQRLGAWFIDEILLLIFLTIIATLLKLPIPENSHISFLGFFYFSHPLGLLTRWLYYSLMESSSKQASIGKLAMGIKVVDLKGQRISFGKATGRFFGKVLSGLILCIGYIWFLFSKENQCLHDLMSNCFVVKK
jgi:uncharacterized RDD family membrane protein YckC